MSEENWNFEFDEFENLIDKEGNICNKEQVNNCLNDLNLIKDYKEEDKKNYLRRLKDFKEIC